MITADKHQQNFFFSKFKSFPRASSSMATASVILPSCALPPISDNDRICNRGTPSSISRPKRHRMDDDPERIADNFRANCSLQNKRTCYRAEENGPRDLPAETEPEEEKVCAEDAGDMASDESGPSGGACGPAPADVPASGSDHPDPVVNGRVLQDAKSDTPASEGPAATTHSPPAPKPQEVKEVHTPTCVNCASMAKEVANMKKHLNLVIGNLHALTAEIRVLTGKLELVNKKHDNNEDNTSSYFS